MKIRLFSIFLTLLLMLTTDLQNTYAQDYTTWGLPEGAKARLGKGTIEDIRFSPDNKTLAVAGSIGIWLYDVESGEEVSLLTGAHRSGVTSISFDPVRGTLASGGYDGNILLWDVVTGKHIQTFGTGNTWPVYSIAFSPTSGTLASGNYDGKIVLWDVSKGIPKQTLIGHTKPVTRVTFSPDGQTLASVSWDKTLRLWNMVTAENQHTVTAGDTFGFSSVAFHPDGKTVATGGGDIRFWDVPTGTLKRTLTDTNMSSVGSLHFSPDGLIFASMDSSMLRLWDTSSDTPKQKITLGYSWRNSVRFSPNGRLLACGTEYGPLRLWDVVPAATTLPVHSELPGEHPGGSPSAVSTAFSPNSQMFAYSLQVGNPTGFYSAINLWNVSEAKQIFPDAFYNWQRSSHLTTQTFTTENPDHYHEVMLSFLPDNQTLVGAVKESWPSASRAGKLILWDVSTGSRKQTFSLYSPNPNNFVRGFLSFSPDGLTLAAYRQVTVWEPQYSTIYLIDLWDVPTGRLKHTLKGHTDFISGAVFSPDSKTLASWAIWGHPPEGPPLRDHDFLLWDVPTGRLKHILTEHTDYISGAVFSPDSKTLVSSEGNDTIRWWDATTGGSLSVLIGRDFTSSLGVVFSVDDQTFTTHSPFREPHFWYRSISDLLPWWQDAFSPYLFASSSTPVWDVSTGELKSDNERAFIFGVASPDRSTLVHTWGGTTNLALWDLAAIAPKHTITGHTSPVTSVSFSPDGKTLASASREDIRLWDVERAALKDRWYPSGAYSIAFSSNPRVRTNAGISLETLAVGGLIYQPWKIVLSDTTTGEQVQEFIGHTDTVNSIAFDTVSRGLVTGSRDNTIRWWGVYTGKTSRIFTGHTDSVLTVAINPIAISDIDFASGSADKTVLLWDAIDEEPLRTLTGHTDAVLSVAYNPSLVSATPEVSRQGGGFQVMLASGSADKTIRLWDGDGGAHLGTLIGHGGGVTSLAFHPDGTTLMSGSDDTTIRWWELGTVVLREFDDEADGTIVWIGADSFTGTHKHTFVGHTGGVTSLAFTPVLGWTLASGSRDGTVLLWDLFAFTPPHKQELAEDVNNDGVVNIQDIVLVASNFGATGENAADVNGDRVVNIRDLVQVAARIGAVPAAPLTLPQNIETPLTRTQVEQWLRQAGQFNLTDTTSKQGILFLEQLLAALTPKETELLANYPNPFNPETWIPYQLAAPAEVSISIYATDGKLVRTLTLGHRSAGTYQDKSRAAHWDGKNEVGEPVASGVYFYTLTAGDFNATRKMLIRK